MGLVVKEHASRNGTTKEPVDWQSVKAEILHKLDLVAEYTLLGVQFSQSSPNSKGILRCHALRSNGDTDECPSAFVNVQTGVYHDSGGVGETLDFFNFALKHGDHGRWIDILRHYAEKAGVSLGKLAPGKGGRFREAIYLYRQPSGEVGYAVFRYRLPNGKKSFSQHPPDGKGGWTYGEGCMDGVSPLPYRLPELLASDPSIPVWIVEGEKDADRAAEAGLVATTGHGGANNTERVWPRILEPFRGRICVVVPDNDPGGRTHAEKVAAYLKPVASSVKVLELPGLAPKGDLSDWLDQGNPVAELERLATAAPEWEPGRKASEPEPGPDIVADDGEHWGEPILDATLPAIPFPIEVLPAALADFALEGGESLACPVDYVAVSCLAVASGAIARSVAIALKEGWVESPSLYVGIVGDPGMTKSPALGQASRPLWALTEEYIAIHREETKRARENNEDPPPLRRIAVDDATVEALAPILQDNPRGLIMVRDELTAWVSGLNQYKNGKGADRQFFLSAWSGSPVVVDRKRSEGIPIHIPRPFLSVLGALTPGMLTELADVKNRDDGFLDRLLFSFPEPVEVRWQPNGVHPMLVDDWERAIRQLQAVPMILDDKGRGRPFVARLTPEASAQFGDWYNAHCKEAEENDFPPYLKGTWAKLRAYCGRLALVTALLHRSYDPTGDDRPLEIQATSIYDALLLINYFKRHARRVRFLLRGAGIDNEDARAILRWCGKTGRRMFTERDAKQNFRTRFANDNHALNEAISWLRDHRCIRPKETEPGKRGRTSHPYEINPALWGYGAKSEESDSEF